MYDNTAPANVTDHSATPIAVGKILLEWTKPTDGDYKQVNISWISTDGSAGASSTIVTASADPQSFEVSGLTDGKNYEFTFQTQDNTGNTSTSTTKPSAVSDATPPGDVTGYSAIALENSKIHLAWTEPTTTDYKQVNISWTTTAAPETEIGNTTVAKGTTTFDTGLLTDGIKYTFTFQTQDNAGNIKEPGVTAEATAASTGSEDTSPPGEVTGQSAAKGSPAGTIIVTWTAEPDGDFQQVHISWESDTFPESSGSAIVLKDIKSFTSPVLTSGRSYTFTLKTEDDVGNKSNGVTTTAVEADPSDLRITTISATSGPTLAYSGVTGTIKYIHYWAGSSYKPSEAYHVTNHPEGFHSVTALVGDPVTEQALTLPGGNQTFSLCFLTADATPIYSTTYTFTWNSGTSTYGTAQSRSLAASSPVSRPGQTQARTYTARTTRRPASNLTPVAFTPPATTPAQWLAPKATEPVPTPPRTPTTRAVPTTRLSAYAQAKAKAILAAYAMPSTDTSMAKLPAKATTSSSETAVSQEDEATPITTSPDSVEDASIFLTGYSSQPGTNPSSAPSPAPDNAPPPAPDRTPGHNPERGNGSSSGLPPAEAVMPAKTRHKEHDEDAEVTDLS